MRAFVAIPIPKPVKNELAKIQQPIAGVKWQGSDQYHLTLKFLGDIDADEARKLQLDLAQVRTASFSITIKGLGFFPDNEHASVLWAGVEEQKMLLRLQQKVENVCLSMNLKARKHSFTPHITLARINKEAGQEIQTWAHQYEELLVPEVSVQEFVLYESELTQKGAKHHRLQTFGLKKD